MSRTVKAISFEKAKMFRTEAKSNWQKRFGSSVTQAKKLFIDYRLNNKVFIQSVGLIGPFRHSRANISQMQWASQDSVPFFTSTISACGGCDLIAQRRTELLGTLTQLLFLSSQQLWLLKKRKRRKIVFVNRTSWSLQNLLRSADVFLKKWCESKPL